MTARLSEIGRDNDGNNAPITFVVMTAYDVPVNMKVMASK